MASQLLSKHGMAFARYCWSFDRRASKLTPKIISPLEANTHIIKVTLGRNCCALSTFHLALLGTLDFKLNLSSVV